MAQGSQQFTPAQILEAGRRAEIEGRVEYAIQFYRHLTDHLPRSAEAMTAREALTKLGASSTSTGGERPFVTPPNGAAGNGPYSKGAPPMTGTAASPFALNNPAAGTAITTRRPQPAPAPNSTVAPKPAFVLPKSRRRYRTGRFVARAFSFFGFIQIGFGVATVILGLLSLFGGGSASLPAIIASQSPSLAAAAGAALIILGLIQVLGGQLARAIFDQASASRDLAAYSRARVAYDAGVSGQHPAEN